MANRQFPLSAEGQKPEYIVSSSSPALSFIVPIELHPANVPPASAAVPATTAVVFKNDRRVNPNPHFSLSAISPPSLPLPTANQPHYSSFHIIIFNYENQ
jgi:hypothetical protein